MRMAGTLVNINEVLRQVSALDIVDIVQVPEKFADIFRSFVVAGSKLHRISKDEVTVFFIPDTMLTQFPEDERVQIIEKWIPKDIKGLLRCGAKFLDAVIYLSLAEEDRPLPKSHPGTQKQKDVVKFALYNDPSKITKYLFFVYFYIMIRAHTPSEKPQYQNQPVPKFLSSILGITSKPGEVADYLASFDLTGLDPAWVKHIKPVELGQETQSRLGLGVAGYRLPAVVDTLTPNKEGWEKHAGALSVTRSFIRGGLCWDFHPATRAPALLTKYGNINKNVTNLILDLYTEQKIEELLKIKKLAVKPVRDEGHINYLTWTTEMHYSATSPIFKQGTVPAVVNYLTTEEQRKVTLYNAKRKAESDKELKEYTEELARLSAE
jgi:hypothetical protein